MAAQLSHGPTPSLQKTKIMAAVRACLLVLYDYKVIQANKFNCCEINYNTTIYRD